MALDEESPKITRVITIRPEGNRNVCATFHGSSLDSCWNVSLRTTNENLMVTLKRKSQGIMKVSWLHPLRTVTVCTKFNIHTDIGPPLDPTPQECHLPGRSWRWGTGSCRWASVRSAQMRCLVACPLHCGTSASDTVSLPPGARLLRPLSTHRCASHPAGHRGIGCLAMTTQGTSSDILQSFYLISSFYAEEGLSTSFWVVDSLLWLLDGQSMWIDAVGPWRHVLKDNL